jgi:hypothetical protein
VAADAEESNLNRAESGRAAAEADPFPEAAG